MAKKNDATAKRGTTISRTKKTNTKSSDSGKSTKRGTSSRTKKS